MKGDESKAGGGGSNRWKKVRAVFLVASAVLALQILPWRGLARLLPGLSPFVALGSAMARRAWSWEMLWALPVLLATWWRPRWFCGHVCPTGYAAAMAQRVRRRDRSRYKRLPRLGPWLLVAALGGAVVGYPLGLWLDPLALFQSFFAAWLGPREWGVWLGALGFVFVLVLGVWRPHAWCQRLCPLGALQDASGLLARWARAPARSPLERDAAALGRRAFLGMLGGGLLALVARRRSAAGTPVLRPPGAAPEEVFGGLCVRCGNCARACPYGIIRPDLGRSGAGGLLTPVLDYSRHYCVEFCHECNKVCPSGAIAHLSLEEKRRVAVGLAEVARARCLVWAQGAACWVCQEYCPYQAIRTVDEGGRTGPEVDGHRCRGCGLCQRVCPAQPEVAIRVRPIRQRRLAAATG